MVMTREVNRMLYDYLVENYKPNEPIFVSDIDFPVSSNNLRQMLKGLCDSGKIKRFDTGIYYIPSVSRLKGGTSIAPGIVARYKYVARNGKIEGYYSGFTFANQMGVTTQVPYIIEIVSNAASAKVREVEIKGQHIMLRKPRVKITEQNYRILQFLDLLKDIDLYADDNSEVAVRLNKYVRDEKMRQEDVDKYLSYYPDKIYRNLYEMRLYNAFAS